MENRNKQIAERLNYLCNIIPDLLSKIPEKDFSFKLTLNKWSKKEILGHLIDSAANNHLRFIRVQFENNPLIEYSNELVKFTRYNHMPKEHVVKFWKAYNLFLVDVIQFIPEDMLVRTCRAEGKVVTLEWLIEDYLKHLEYHLEQIVEY